MPRIAVQPSVLRVAPAAGHSDDRQEARRRLNVFEIGSIALKWPRSCGTPCRPVPTAVGVTSVSVVVLTIGSTDFGGESVVGSCATASTTSPKGVPRTGQLRQVETTVQAALDRAGCSLQRPMKDAPPHAPLPHRGPERDLVRHGIPRRGRVGRGLPVQGAGHGKM